MLDFTANVTIPQPTLIEAIYECIVDASDLRGALEAVRESCGIDALHLSRVERGDETVLCRVGADFHDDPAQSVHSIDGPIHENGRRLVLRFGKTSRVTEQSALLMHLLNHIDRAVTLSGRIGSSETMRRMDSDLLDRLSVGTVFLDARGQVIAATGMAQARLDAGDGLRLRNGSVTATCATADRALQSAIRAALANPCGDSSELLSLDQAEGDRALGVVVQPVAPTAQNEGIACALVIRDSDRRSAPGLDMLRGLFDLTPAEAGLTRILSMGHTLDEAASDLSISRNTARAHLRAIFSKCNINRQTELVRLVLSSVAMLHGPDLPKAA